jgi:hypothetical protein
VEKIRTRDRCVGLHSEHHTVDERVSRSRPTATVYFGEGRSGQQAHDRDMAVVEPGGVVVVVVVIGMPITVGAAVRPWFFRA